MVLELVPPWDEKNFTSRPQNSISVPPRGSFQNSPPLIINLQIVDCGELSCSFVRFFARYGTWYGINYAGTQMTQWDFQYKGTLTSPARLSFVLKVPLRYLRSSIIYSVPCDRIQQRVYFPRSILGQIPAVLSMIIHGLKQIQLDQFVLTWYFSFSTLSNISALPAKEQVSVEPASFLRYNRRPGWVVRKPVNANPGLEVYRCISFSWIKCLLLMFCAVWDYLSSKLKDARRGRGVKGWYSRI